MIQNMNFIYLIIFFKDQLYERTEKLWFDY